MVNNIPAYLLRTLPEDGKLTSKKKANLSFIDKTILNIAGTIKSICLQAEVENDDKQSFIQKIHPNVKLISLIYLVVVVSLVNNLTSQLLVSFIFFLFYILSGLKIFLVYRRIFTVAFVFGFIVVLPASLNVITPGEIIFNLIKFNRPSQFWIYNIPQNIGFTLNGLGVVSLVFLRVLNSVSIAMLVVYTTPFPALVKSFKIMGVPDTFLMIISLAYKYIFILSRTIEETYFALKSRLTGNVKSRNIRDLAGGRLFFVFKKSVIIYENTYYAMVSRGYQGKVKLYSVNKFTYRDIVSLALIALLGIIVILF